VNTRRALARVQRAERMLRGAALGSALLRAAAGALAVFLIAALVDVFIALPSATRRFVPVVALTIGAIVMWRRLRRSGALERGVVSVALWIESRFPALRYALVTAVDPSIATPVPDLERQAAEVRFEPYVRRAARRALTAPAIATVALAGVLLGMPGGVVARVVRPRSGDALDRMATRAVANPLNTIVARVSPPAYSNLPNASLDDPASVQALVGSTVVVEGRTGADAVLAAVGERSVNAAISRGRWSIALSMPPGALAVRFRAGAHERLLVLEPTVDSVPVVTLSLPARDSIYRRAEGTVRLSADVTDDLGLADGAFEYIVSSGGGETFTFKSGRLGALMFAARSGTLAAALSLDSLDLHPGDVIHLRAVARDRNDVTGPGVGFSETRTLRIARPDEYDSLAVEGAPPPEPERDALSQRMLLMLAQALEKRRPSLARNVVLSESRAIAVEQTRLRKRLGELVFTRLGESGAEEGDALERRLERPVNPDSLLAAADRATTILSGASLERNEDETPLVALNRPLLEAYNHMWNAGTELELGAPARAIPWMRKALDALQAARSAERIYLRGRARAVVVDIARVRLAGKDRGTPGTRTPRVPVDAARAARLARFDAMLGLAQAQPAAAADSLLLMRLELLGRDATAVRALEAAADALRRAGDATLPLLRARRTLVAAPPRRGEVSSWGTQ
jgi:hypothetical protein